MRKIKLFLFLSVILAVTAKARWVDIPLEKVITKSDVIVVGEVIKVEPGTAYKTYGIAHLKVIEVIKSNIKLKKGDTIYMHTPLKVEESIDIVHGKGKKGVWLLKKSTKKQTDYASKKGQLYLATYPKDYQPESSKEAIKKMVKKPSK